MPKDHRRATSGRLWEESDDERLLTLWNHRPDLDIPTIGRMFHRTNNSIKNRVQILKGRGFEVTNRHAPAPKLKPFTMPAGMRYADDPKASLDRGSPWMPRRPDAQSAASSLIMAG